MASSAGVKMRPYNPVWNAASRQPKFSLLQHRAAQKSVSRLRVAAKHNSCDIKIITNIFLIWSHFFPSLFFTWKIGPFFPGFSSVSTWRPIPLYTRVWCRSTLIVVKMPGVATKQDNRNRKITKKTRIKNPFSPFYIRNGVKYVNFTSQIFRLI